MGILRQLLVELFETLDALSTDGILAQRRPAWVTTHCESYPLNERGLVVDVLYLFEINLDAAPGG